MPKCPDCFFELNLHEHKLKYKCSRCRKWFSKIEVDAKEFREANKMIRQEAKKQARKEALRENNKRYWKEHPEKMKEVTKRWREENKDKIKSYRLKFREKNPDYNARKSAEYYQKDKEKILARQKEYRMKEGGQTRKNRLKELYHENIDVERLKSQIKYWKKRQVALAVQFVENGLYTAHKPTLSS